MCYRKKYKNKQFVKIGVMFLKFFIWNSFLELETIKTESLVIVN